ncbi:MAG: cupredoxin family protein [Hyphomicrobiales bacterium]|nr:cupredoxin family protein [Hyphomicrobiales bacterium]
MKNWIAAGLGLAFSIGAATPSFAHGDEKHFSAGAPGDPKKPARTVEIVMHEGDGAMSFTPDRVEARRGEQVRFILRNEGALAHEFMLATVRENDEHAKVMERFPDMEHDDPNGKRLDPGKSAEILWKFTKRGTFEFACLIPGHRQAGMHGTVVVK